MFVGLEIDRFLCICENLIYQLTRCICGNQMCQLIKHIFLYIYAFALLMVLISITRAALCNVVNLKKMIAQVVPRLIYVYL